MVDGRGGSLRSLWHADPAARTEARPEVLRFELSSQMARRATGGSARRAGADVGAAALIRELPSVAR